MCAHIAVSEVAWGKIPSGFVCKIKKASVTRRDAVCVCVCETVWESVLGVFMEYLLGV